MHSFRRRKPHKNKFVEQRIVWWRIFCHIFPIFPENIQEDVLWPVYRRSLPLSSLNEVVKVHFWWSGWSQPQFQFLVNYLFKNSTIVWLGMRIIGDYSRPKLAVSIHLDAYHLTSKFAAFDFHIKPAVETWFCFFIFWFLWAIGIYKTSSSISQIGFNNYNFVFIISANTDGLQVLMDSSKEPQI